MTRSVFNHRRGAHDPYATEVLRDAPIVYWRLAEPSGTSAADATGNGHTGTYTPGTGTITLDVASPLANDAGDKSISFQNAGGGDCYTISAASTAWDTTSMSVEAWVKPASGRSVKHGIASIMDSVSNARWYFRIQPTTGDLEHYPHTGLALNTVITFDVWTHLVITFDASDSKYRVYVNGALNFTTVASSVGAATNKPFTIGHNRANGVGTEEFYGGMDEVAVYGTALSLTRIAAHYAAAS